MDGPKNKKLICDEKNTDAGCSQIPNIICSNKKALLFLNTKKWIQSMTNNILKGPNVGEFNFCRLSFHTLTVLIKGTVLYQNFFQF